MVESEGQVIHHADTLDDNFVLRYANRHLNKPMRFSFAYIFISRQIVSKPLLFIWEPKTNCVNNFTSTSKTYIVCMHETGRLDLGFGN